MMQEISDIPTLTRRNFFRAGAASVSGYWLLPLAQPLNVEAKENVTPRGGAEYCIFLFLNGGASQLDSFDIKEGKWTPPDFDVRTVKPGIRLPYSLFPNLSGQLDHLAISRSVEAWESAHSRAQYYMQVGHPFSPARRNEMPALGAVIASELASRRKDSDWKPHRSWRQPRAHGPPNRAGLAGLPKVASEEESQTDDCQAGRCSTHSGYRSQSGQL